MKHEMMLSSGEIEYFKQKDGKERRKKRLLQVRKQEKEFSKVLRRKHQNETMKIGRYVTKTFMEKENIINEKVCSEMSQRYNLCLKQIGHAHRNAKTLEKELKLDAKEQVKITKFNRKVQNYRSCVAGKVQEKAFQSTGFAQRQSQGTKRVDIWTDVARKQRKKAKDFGVKYLKTQDNGRNDENQDGTKDEKEVPRSGRKFVDFGTTRYHQGDSVVAAASQGTTSKTVDAKTRAKSIEMETTKRLATIQEEKLNCKMRAQSRGKRALRLVNGRRAGHTLENGLHKLATHEHKRQTYQKYAFKEQKRTRWDTIVYHGDELHEEEQKRQEQLEKEFENIFFDPTEVQGLTVAPGENIDRARATYCAEAKNVDGDDNANDTIEGYSLGSSSSESVVFEAQINENDRENPHNLNVVLPAAPRATTSPQHAYNDSKNSICSQHDTHTARTGQPHSFPLDYHEVSTATQLVNNLHHSITWSDEHDETPTRNENSKQACNTQHPEIQQPRISQPQNLASKMKWSNENLHESFDRANTRREAEAATAHFMDELHWEDKDDKNTLLDFGEVELKNAILPGHARSTEMEHNSTSSASVGEKANDISIENRHLTNLKPNFVSGNAKATEKLKSSTKTLKRNDFLTPPVENSPSSIVSSPSTIASQSYDEGFPLPALSTGRLSSVGSQSSIANLLLEDTQASEMQQFMRSHIIGSLYDEHGEVSQVDTTSTPSTGPSNDSLPSTQTPRYESRLLSEHLNNLLGDHNARPSDNSRLDSSIDSLFQYSLSTAESLQREMNMSIDFDTTFDHEARSDCDHNWCSMSSSVESKLSVMNLRDIKTDHTSTPNSTVEQQSTSGSLGALLSPSDSPTRHLVNDDATEFSKKKSFGVAYVPTSMMQATTSPLKDTHVNNIPSNSAQVPHPFPMTDIPDKLKALQQTESEDRDTSELNRTQESIPTELLNHNFVNPRNYEAVHSILQTSTTVPQSMVHSLNSDVEDYVPTTCSVDNDGLVTHNQTLIPSTADITTQPIVLNDQRQNLYDVSTPAQSLTVEHLEASQSSGYLKDAPLVKSCESSANSLDSLKFSTASNALECYTLDDTTEYQNSGDDFSKLSGQSSSSNSSLPYSVTATNLAKSFKNDLQVGQQREQAVELKHSSLKPMDSRGQSLATEIIGNEDEFNRSNSSSPTKLNESIGIASSLQHLEDEQATNISVEQHSNEVLATLDTTGSSECSSKSQYSSSDHSNTSLRSNTTASFREQTFVKARGGHSESQQETAYPRGSNDFRSFFNESTNSSTFSDKLEEDTRFLTEASEFLSRSERLFANPTGPTSDLSQRLFVSDSAKLIMDKPDSSIYSEDFSSSLSSSENVEHSDTLRDESISDSDSSAISDLRQSRRSLQSTNKDYLENKRSIPELVHEDQRTTPISSQRFSHNGKMLSLSINPHLHPMQLPPMPFPMPQHRSQAPLTLDTYDSESTSSEGRNSQYSHATSCMEDSSVSMSSSVNSSSSVLQQVLRQRHVLESDIARLGDSRNSFERVFNSDTVRSPKTFTIHAETTSANKPAEKAEKTLAQALRQSRKNFIARSEARQRELSQRRGLPKKPSNLLLQKPSSSVVRHVDSSGVLTRLSQGVRASMSNSEMRQRTRRLYSQLPEVRKDAAIAKEKHARALRAKKVREMDASRRARFHNKS